MSSPLCFIDKPIFDALVVYCWMKEKYGNIPVKLDLPAEKLSEFPGLPIAYHKDGWSISSVMLFDCDYKLAHYEGSWKKRWCVKHDFLADFSKNQRKINTGKGYFKSFDSPLPLYDIRTVWFYFKGDAERVKKLITDHLPGIGKKISQGYGFFDDFVIDPAADDIFDMFLLRPIPLNSRLSKHYKETNDHSIRFCGYRPSYYLPENQTKCIYPSL